MEETTSLTAQQRLNKEATQVKNRIGQRLSSLLTFAVNFSLATSNSYFRLLSSARLAACS